MTKVEQVARLSDARRRALVRVRDSGRSGSKEGYYNRVNGLAEFVWKLRDGTEAADSDIGDDWYDRTYGAKLIGERLTPAGRAALTEGQEG